MKTRFATLALTGLLAAPAVAVAQDDSLYPEPSAPDASFVRIIAPEADTAIIDGEDVGFDGLGVSPYVEVSPGEVPIVAGDAEAEVEVGANSHYTYLSTAEDGTLIEDGVTESPAQADLLLYNVTDRDAVDLYAVEADTLALEDVAGMAHGSVGLKAPLTLNFELRDDDETLVALDPVELRRGTATTVLITGTGDDLSAGTMTSVYD